uniref:Ig-like domain-containing protein n=1 Tax=Anopheles minimus TaxID=112268 RepID=A0A182W0S8_9DIPT
MEIYNHRRLGAVSGAAVCVPGAERPTAQDAATTVAPLEGIESRINGGEKEHQHGTRSTTPSLPMPACTDSVASRWKIRGRIYHRSHLHLLLVAAVLLTHMLVNIRIDIIEHELKAILVFATLTDADDAIGAWSFAPILLIRGFAQFMTGVHCPLANDNEYDDVEDDEADGFLSSTKPSVTLQKRHSVEAMMVKAIPASICCTGALCLKLGLREAASQILNKAEPLFISRSEAFKFAVGDTITLPCEVASPVSANPSLSSLVPLTHTNWKMDR